MRHFLCKKCNCIESIEAPHSVAYCTICGGKLTEPIEATESNPTTDLYSALVDAWDKAEDKAHKEYECFGNLNAAGRGTAYGICAEQLRIAIKSS